MIWNRFKKQPSRRVAVVVPMSNRKELTPEEKISFKHLIHFLGKYDKYLVMPKGLDVKFPGFGIKHFDNNFFGSAAAHTKLLLSPRFYKTFINYKFILIYHLDALVFSDQLNQWCDMDYDFIGPPWIKHKEAPYTGFPLYEGKVGNGGFSLRKVHSFLKVIDSQEYFIRPSEYWKYYTSKPWYIQCLNLPKKYLKRILLFNNARLELSRYKDNEESFWANQAKHYYPGFKISSVKTALRFGFECVPRYCFEKNNHTLPFGCHAWQKYDKDFWEPHLLK